MGCFSCLSPRRDDVSMIDDRGQNRSSADFPDQNGTGAKSFTFQQLINATRSFKVMIGEGGFGKVYKGKLENGQASCFTSLGIHGSVWFSGKNEGKEGKIVAIKWLNHEGIQGSQEFIMEVLLLSLLRHSNLVCLIGYCTDGDQRLLVYEYMPMGSLEDHLFDVGPNKAPLEWNTRIKIAVGTARGLEYLHCKANPPVIYRDLKSANILLDSDFHPKLSDFGLAKFGPVGDNTHVTTRVMGTHGYCAPEYAMSGKLTLKSDVYSFGVVLLELITGRMAIDSTRLQGEQNLVNWARPLFKDRRRFSQLVDPLLRGRFPVRCLHHAIAITAMCLQEQPTYRPLISDVLVALEYLASQPYNPEAYSHSSPRSPSPSSPLHA